ncbi:MAG: hypothetical protein F4190_04110 [Acidimicrobiales bacterium]|nr:hypothetical protein [Acidimicrobiales bacterium]MYG87701.1 hypothetical protein [Acidimicrobiales bacterium]MYI28952.1 hypothetical protein [Acidimicrobiales bacterium]
MSPQAKSRRWLGALSAVLVLSAAALVPISAAAAQSRQSGLADIELVRYGGTDRYATSLLVAEAVAADAGGSLEWTVLVSGERWTDAVVAAPVAGALGAPVLMISPGELRADARAFLQRVGVSKALIVGPEHARGRRGHGPGRGVSAAVIDALEDAGIAAERVAGSDRFATAVAAARRLTPGAMPGLGRTAIVASGDVFADALVAGPFAAHGSHPVLLTAPDSLNEGVAGYLAEAGISHVVLMGGAAALASGVEASIRGLGASVTRLAGATRYDTAVKAAELVDDRYSDTAGKDCFATSTIGLARARVPFDSFSAAPLLGRLCAPLVLADPASIPADTAAYLDRARTANGSVGLRVFGGDAAVSQAAIDAYLSGEGSDSEEADAEPNMPTAGSCGDASGDGAVQLVPSTFAWDPAWSPDCSKLVYSRADGLWTVNNDGSGRALLVPADGTRRYGAVWSPLGDRIAYVNGYSDGNDWISHIWTVNADGRHNNQRTSGELIDSWPTWSPDGKRIAFQRTTGRGIDQYGARNDGDKYIVVMASYGKNLTELNPGGAWEYSPAWSPDGSKLAFVASGYLMVSDVDGSNARRVIADLDHNGGLSWSPDGRRIVFIRGYRDESAVVAIGVDGADEIVVFDEDVRVRAPRWSRDGQRIAFHTVEEHDAKRRILVVSTDSGTAARVPDCRPRGVRSVTAGFPLPTWAAPSKGTLRVAVLFMDFSDAEADYTTHREAETALPRAEEFLESASYGQLDVVFMPHHEWLRAGLPYRTYFAPTVASDALSDWASAGAVELADDAVDFTRADLVLVVFPSVHFSGGLASGSATADGVSVITARVNTFEGASGGLGSWGDTAAHEIIHALGLPDFYPYGDAHQRQEAPAGHQWVQTTWGPMGLHAWFLAARDDRRLMHRWEFTNGKVSDYVPGTWMPREMLAWSRWQLGWLSDTQVACVTEAKAAVKLAPIAAPGDGVAMAAVPLSAREVIVIESRRRLGEDADFDASTLPNVVSGTSRQLAYDGILVYTVDALLDTGALPLRIAGDPGNGQTDDYPLLQAGDSVTLHGHTIAVTADDGETHTVSITRSATDP